MYQPPQPPYGGGFGGGNTDVMSTKDWLITLLLLAIPCVGIVLLFVWAFSSDTNENKKNYCRATLIFAAIVFAFYIVLWIVMIALGAAVFSSFSNYM